MKKILLIAAMLAVASCGGVDGEKDDRNSNDSRRLKKIESVFETQLFIVESRAGIPGETEFGGIEELLPENAVITLSRTNDRVDFHADFHFCGDIDVKEKNFSLEVTGIPYNLEGSSLLIDCDELDGICRVDTLDELFSNVFVSGVLQLDEENELNADIVFSGFVKQMPFYLDIKKVTADENEVASREALACVQYVCQNKMLFANETEDSIEVSVRTGLNTKTISIEPLSTGNIWISSVDDLWSTYEGTIITIRYVDGTCQTVSAESIGEGIIFQKRWKDWYLNVSPAGYPEPRYFSVENWVIN